MKDKKLRQVKVRLPRGFAPTMYEGYFYRVADGRVYSIKRGELRQLAQASSTDKYGFVRPLEGSFICHYGQTVYLSFATARAQAETLREQGRRHLVMVSP